jgi:hypothetical protein
MTAQTPEKLTYNGEQYAMCTEPLSEFVAVGGKLPEFVWPDTACWRGYIGEWEITADIPTVFSRIGTPAQYVFRKANCSTMYMEVT